jgi:DNA-binding PadR family transcriptional regulator
MSHKHHIFFKFHGFDDDAPFGKWFGHHGFGPGGFGHGRFFERGILKYVILHLIQEQPRHGYDIIQELEKKFHGFYSPSAGTVYPILQLLEDQGYVTINQKDGKKVYSITDDGEKFLKEHEEEIQHIKEMKEHLKENVGSQIHELKGEVKQTAKLIFHYATQGALKDPETMKELRMAFADFRNKIEEIFSKRNNAEGTNEVIESK